MPKAFQPRLSDFRDIRGRGWSVHYAFLIQYEASVQSGIEDSIRNNQIRLYFLDHFLAALVYAHILWTDALVVGAER